MVKAKNSSDSLPISCIDWANERLDSLSGASAMLKDDIKICIDRDLHPKWNILQRHASGPEEFRDLFILACVHKTHFYELTGDGRENPKELLSLYEKISSHALKLSVLLEKSDQINRNLNDNMFTVVKKALLTESYSPATEDVERIFTKKDEAHSLRKGLPRASNLLRILAAESHTRSNELRFFKDEYLPTKINLVTAPRTMGIKCLAKQTTNKELFKKPCWEQVAGIIYALHSEHGDLDANSARKIWKDSQ